MDCGVELAKFETPSYTDFIDGLESPADVSLLQIEPLSGVGILNFGLPLCHAMIDRILGGRAVATQVDRPPSEIEIALLDDVIQLVADEWCQQWQSQLPLRPHTLGHDSNARFLKTSLPEAVILSVRLAVQLGENKGQIEIGMPYSMVEPMLKEARERENSRGAETRARKPEWRPSYNEISVPVQAEWKVRQMLTRDVLSLSLGDVLPMDPDLIARTHVRMANTREFIGSVGIQNGRIAVQLTKHLALT